MNIFTKLTILCLSLVLVTAGVVSYFADNQLKLAIKKESTNTLKAQFENLSTALGSQANFDQLNYIPVNFNLRLLSRNGETLDTHGNLNASINSIDLGALGNSESVFDIDDFLVIAKRQSANILLVEIPKNHAFASLNSTRRGIAIIVIPMLVLTVIVAFISARIFIRPINKLSQVADEIGKGNLDIEIPISSKDELGNLAENLIGSAKQLAEKIESEKKVNELLKAQHDEIEVKKNELESFNRMISDSISYAKRILSSTLPPLNSLTQIFPDSFIYYEPKDVIGGDFYWFERIRKGNSEYMVIACADCTGHGVPGAIMSIMGSNQLTSIVYYQNYLDPRKIITRLNKAIRFELQQQEAEDTNRDGMEIAVCVIDLDTLKMEFSGAGMPLRVKKKSAALQTYKSPRVMVGGIEGDESEVSTMLTKESIQLEEGDKVYMATDGFQDQFGGDEDRKFMVKRFHELLDSTTELSMSDQMVKVRERYNEWTKGVPQTDDILIMGIEIV